MGRIIAAIALIAVLVVGGGIIATTAYQAGLNTTVVTTVTETGATVVTPAIVPHAAYGWGWGWGGPGFGVFGFLFVLFFLFLVFGLIRAVLWSGRRGWGGPGWGPGGPGWGPGGPGGPGSWGPSGHRDRWRDRARPYFEELHREAHGGPTTGDAPTGSTPPLS